MEYKKPESFYEIIKGIGKSLYFNFISGNPYAGDGFSSEKKIIGKWDGKISYKKADKKKTIDNKL